MVLRSFLVCFCLAMTCAAAGHCLARNAAPAADMAADRAKSDALTAEQRDQARKLFETAFGLLQSGDVQAATLGFERGLAIDPANVIANFYMAEALVLLGDNTRARVFYSRVIAFDSSSAEALKAQAALTNLPTPSPPVAAPGPDKTYSPQSANIVKSASVGGTGGDIFDDTSANPNHLPITGFRIVVNLNPADHRQVIIGTLQVQWSGLDGPTHGGRGPLAQASSPVQFAPSEAIRKVAINSLTFNYPASPPPIWVTGLRIFTNKSSYAFGNMSFGPTTECVVPESKVLIGFFGRSGSYIDQLGCLVGDAKDETIK
jgi:hypothetical protein